MASPSGALLGPASSALEGAPAAARRPRRRAGAGRPRPRRRAPAPRAPRAGTRAGAPRPRRPPPPRPPRLRAAPRVRWSARLSERLQIASFESAQPTWKHALQAWRRSLDCRLHLDAARAQSGTHVCIGLGRVRLGGCATCRARPGAAAAPGRPRAARPPARPRAAQRLPRPRWPRLRRRPRRRTRPRLRDLPRESGCQAKPCRTGHATDGNVKPFLHVI